MERLFQVLDELDDLIEVLRYRFMAYRSGRPAAQSVRKSSPAGAAVASPAVAVSSPAVAVALPARAR